MRPQLFIGSSVESLDIAYSLQESLEYEANVTVWTQGVFKLSSNSLDDLLEILETSDFGIFVFTPDDISIIRNKKYASARDNIIFELGLFIGKLGKGRVFYLVPQDSEKLRLPTDLIGVKPGTYNDKRDDGNLLAALGPFCNQVRGALQGYVVENIAGLKNESVEARGIVAKKSDLWEYYLASQLLEDKLKEINNSYYELENHLVVQRKKSVSGEEFWGFFQDSIATHQYTLKLLNNTIEELNKSFGALGEPGKSIEIKNAVDRIIQLCKEQVAWEFELNSMDPPPELEPAKIKMAGLTKSYIDQINEIAKRTRETMDKVRSGEIEDGVINLTFTINWTGKLDGVVEIFKKHLFEGN